MEVVYRPVKLLNREVLDTFRCLPVSENSDGTVTADKRLLVHEKDVLATATKNAEVMSKAFAELSKAHAVGNRCRMIVPLNSYALASGEGATLIVQVLRELDKSLSGAVIVEYIDMPQSLNLDMLADMMVPALPFLDKYLAEPRPISNKDNFTIYSNCNYFGVSLNMEKFPETRDAAVGLLTEFWAEATKSRLKVVIQGVKEQAILDKAQQYEVFAMDGPLIGPDQETLI
jgi:hypothetical protein